MPNCELSIRLDRPDRVYAAGERVRGRLEVRATDVQSCRRLTLTWGWETRGTGNRYSVEDTITLAEDVSWEGEIVSYPFEFTLPSGPLSYDGHLLSVVWFARAAADLPLALDAFAREEFRVTPPATSHAAHLGPEYRPPRQRAPHLGPGWLIAGIAFLFGLGALLITGRNSLGGTLAPADALALGLGCAVLASAGAIALLATWAGDRRLGAIDMRIDRDSAAPGEPLHWSVRLEPRRRIEVERVRAQLVGRERVVEGTGRGRSVRSHRIHHSAATLEPRRTLQAGEVLELQGVLKVPEEAGYTFAAPHHDVLWGVSIELEISGWPDVRRDYDVTIRPAAALPETTTVAP